MMGKNMQHPSWGRNSYSVSTPVKLLMNNYITIKHTLSYLPILLFLLISGHHFYLVHKHQLSPWLGGGYGMFSTTDYGPSRFIKVFTLNKKIIQEEIEVPEHLSQLSKQVRSLPNNTNIKNFAIKLENYLTINHHSAAFIRVEIWKTNYDSETLKPSYQKLNTLDYKTNY